MKRSRHFALYMLLVIFSISLLLPVFSAQAASSRSESPDANVTRNDMSLVSLKGDWQFYWQQALTPEDFANPSEQTDTTPPQGATIKVPSSWGEQTLGPTVNDGQPIPRFGYATYRKQLTLAPEQVGTNMALLLESVGSAYRVWVNGELFDGLGNVATTQESETPWIRLNLVYFTPQTEQLDIVIQTSNYSFRESGIFGDTKIGEANALTLYVFKRYVLQDLLFIGALLMIGLYHFIIYFNNKRTVDVIWLGSICIAIALRALLLNKFLFYSVLPSLSWELLMHLQFIMRFLAILFYLYLIRSLYPLDVHKLVHRIAVTVCLLMMVYVTIVPPREFTVTFALNTIIVVAILGYHGLYVAIAAYVKKREGAWINILAVFLLLGSVIYDYFLFTTSLSSVQLLPYSALAYALLMAYTVSYRYSLIQKRNLELAQELREINTNLETTVAERTEKLQESNDQLHKLVEQRSQLMTNIAHDMGSPMLGVQSSLHIIAEENLPEKERRTVVELILMKVNHVKHLIDDLFQLAKLESRQSNFHWEVVPVARLEEELGEHFRLLLTQQDRQLNIFITGKDVGEHTAHVRVDRHQLRRVVQNLIDNAVKFSDKEDGPIEFKGMVSEVVDGPDRRNEWRVEVVDYGTGISEDQLPLLFDRFYTRNPNLQEGSGLGLAIVKQIVELHGGTVGVRSEHGKGSTFYFSLPVVH